MYMRLDAPQDSVKVGVDQVAHAASDGPHRRRERLLRRRHAQRTAAAQPSTGDFIQPVGLGWYGEFGSRSRLVRSSAARWFGWSAGGRRARSALVASVAAAAALAAAASILALVQILDSFFSFFRYPIIVLVFCERDCGCARSIIAPQANELAQHHVLTSLISTA